MNHQDDRQYLELAADRYEWSAARVGILIAGLLVAVLIWSMLDTSAPTADPSAAVLTPQAKNLAIIFVITITLWASEVIPIAIGALSALALLPLLGVVTTRAAIQAFMGPVFIFVLAMFILAGVIHRVGLDKRFALFLLSKAGSDPRRVLAAFMIGTAVLSTIISDVPACAVFMALGLGAQRARR